MSDMATFQRDDHVDPQCVPLRLVGPAQSRRSSSAPLLTRNVDPTLLLRQPTGQDGNDSAVQLYLLSGFRLVVDGEFVQVGMMGERLLAALACRGRQVTRRQIANALWPDVTSARARTNLRTALYRLRQRVPAIHVTSSHLLLPLGAQVDLEQSIRLAQRILSSDQAADPQVLSEALRSNLYDDLLPDWDDEWLTDYQYRYRQLRLTALEALSHQLVTGGRQGAAVQTALAAVQADPLRDSAYETLIRACLAQGNRHEAFIHYTTYCRVLREELGLDPPASIGRLLSSA